MYFLLYGTYLYTYTKLTCSMAPIRKPKLQYSNDNWLEAIAEVKMRTLSTREAANKYGVPQSTIMDRIKGRYAPEPLKSGMYS